MNKHKLTAIRDILGGLSLCCIAVCTQANADPVLVVHPDAAIDRISRSELQSLLLGTANVTSADGPLIMLELRDRETQAAIYQEYLKKSPVQMRAHWAKMVFTGTARPPKKLEQDELYQEVMSSKNVIAYLPTMEDAAKLKVVDITP